MTDESLFAAALALSPAGRAAYLDAHCPDPAVREQVEALLAAADASNPLDRRPVDVEQTVTRTQSPPEPSASVGDRVGPYKLLEKIGEGGMGEVWVADQQEPIKRRVALKLIKPGMDSRSVLGRFEAERQALAVMDHPNIAKVLDAGTTPDGRPYFVMELVKGTPITEFADARKLTPKQRLELFVPVCQAIQHAHMKGIIHRDIKPSNVLVALHDETPVPKVIDFGVAKAVGQQLTEKTIYTGFGALVGTPAYMAPEQATFNQLDVDTRADVYALGVLLYELLAGSPPIEKDRLKKAALDEVLRIVREEEPPRPSQRLSTADTRASIAATRGSEPAKLSALMKGELDWIVMKALEKDRTRRYDSANGFAADVQRYLSGEPVQAVPPSVGYRLRKFYRRNRAAVLVGVAFTLMLMTGVTVATMLAIQARQAEGTAREREQQAREQTAIAEKQSDRAAKLSTLYLDAMTDAKLQAAGSRIDADLLEYKNDPRLGLLRLARPLDSSTGWIDLGETIDGGRMRMVGSVDESPDFVKLREFQAAAVIAAGQEFVPLVPPIDSGNYFDEVSPDGRYYILPPEQSGLKLLALPSLAERGVLREAGERLVRWGFSPDSQTAWTQDSDSVVRFWNTDATLRAKTPLRPDRFIYPAGLTADNLRTTVRSSPPNAVLVADGVAVLQTEYPEWEWEADHTGQPTRMKPKKGTTARKGPTDLYSTRTGQFIRRLDQPGRRLAFGSEWNLSPDKRWLLAIEEPYDDRGRWPPGGAAQVVILSTEDGRELARLDQPWPTSFLYVQVSPTGKWVITYPHGVGANRQPPTTDHVRLWNSATWQPAKGTAFHDAMMRQKYKTLPSFVTDDVFSLVISDGGEGTAVGVFHIDRPGSWLRYDDLGYSGPGWEAAVGELGGTLIRCGRVITDPNTFQRLKPPVGRKYAAELAKLAPDGRFWEGLDTVTEKDLPYHEFGGKFFPGFGHVDIRRYHDELDGNRGYDDAELRILPDPKRLDIPPEMIELWAQVVVGGELGPDGGFQSWDQPTWAAKQRELAAMKPPYADFPFPGWVAQDPHQWHLIRAHEMPQNQTRADRIREWRRLTGRTRREPEPDTWRTKETLPPPRSDK